MIYLIYMAAGSARRFGANKLLEPLQGRSVYQYGLDTLCAAANTRADCRVLVVSRTADILASARARGCIPVESPDSEKGISYTIRAGVAAAGPLQTGDYLLFVPADQPGLTLPALQKLLAAADAGCFAASAVYAGQVGSPGLFSAALAPALCALEGDTGGRRVLNRYVDKVTLVPLDDPGQLADIDTPADLARIQKLL